MEHDKDHEHTYIETSAIMVDASESVSYRISIRDDGFHPSLGGTEPSPGDQSVSDGCRCSDVFDRLTMCVFMLNCLLLDLNDEYGRI